MNRGYCMWIHLLRVLARCMFKRMHIQGLGASLLDGQGPNTSTADKHSLSETHVQAGHDGGRD